MHDFLILTRTRSDNRTLVDVDCYTRWCDPRNGVVDLERSYILRLGKQRERLLVEKALSNRFCEYSVAIGSFLAFDQDQRSVALMMLNFVIRNCVKLGDDGTWCYWHASDAKIKGKAKPLAYKCCEMHQDLGLSATPHKPDYSDDAESFRFPSLSCLRGLSWPLSQLQGNGKFGQQFGSEESGIYIVFDPTEVLYVGMSQGLSKRLCSANAHHKLKVIIKAHPSARLAIIPYPEAKLRALNGVPNGLTQDVGEARIRRAVQGLEKACIGFYEPRYNGKGQTDDPMHRGGSEVVLSNGDTPLQNAAMASSVPEPPDAYG